MKNQTKKQKRLLTGDRPTGKLHLGHYVGSLENRVKLQNQGFEPFIIIADFQVLTDRPTEKLKEDASKIEKNILELVMDYLSVGIDPKKSTIFIQSKIPELAELFVYFSMLTTLGELERNPTVKEEARSMGIEKRMSLGLFSYPVSQAADILLFFPDVVPVGQDQLPHIELTREIARTFNFCFGETFKLPEPLVGKFPRLLGLDGEQKMSKSRNNAIFLSDSPDEVYDKIKTAKTDSGKEIVFNPKEKPCISNLMTIYQIAAKKSFQEIEAEFQGKGYVDFKKTLTQVLNEFLAPIREKRKELEKNISFVKKVIKQGTEKAQEEGKKNMKIIKEAMGMEYKL